MTYERAAEILNPEHREHYESIDIVNEACMLGMKALEKQIPKAVKKATPPYGEECLQFMSVCPRCKYNLTKMLICHEFVTPNYCLYCGQALDWRSEK